MLSDVYSTIDTFYDCIGERFDLNRSVKALSEATNDTGILVSKSFPMRGRAESLIHYNYPEGSIEALVEGQYETHAHEMFRHIGAFPEFTHVMRRSYLSNEEHYKTDIYQTVLRPWGLHSEGLSILKKSGLESHSCWSVRHPEQSELGSSLLARLELLSKQLARAMQLQNRLNRLEENVARCDGALDLLDFGLVLLDGTPKLSFINHTANQIFEENDGIRYARGEIIVADQRSEKKLRESCKFMGKSNCLLTEDISYLEIRRPSGKPSLSIFVIPIKKNHPLELNTTSIALMIFDPLKRSAFSGKMVQITYGFTPAETKLAVALMHGGSVEQYANAKCVSVNTVRTQLRNLFAKTETTRQGELISLLFRSCADIVLGRQMLR